MTFIAAYLTGIQYRLASLLIKGTQLKIASSTYSADLLGSAVGAFLVAVFLFPLLGLVTTGIILAIINLISASIVLTLKK